MIKKSHISTINKKDIAPLFINSRGILFQDDCLNVMAEIASDAVDCIFADPPFNLNKPYLDTNYEDKMNERQYDLWMEQWLYEGIRILKPGGSLFIYHMPSYLIKIAYYLNNISFLKFRNWIALNMKSGFPIKNRLHPAHYGLLYYVKNGANSTFNIVRSQTPLCRHCGKLIKDYGGYRDKFKKWEDENGTPWIQISDFWDDTRPARHDKRREKRINELPYEIAERAILLSTRKGDIVFDPFGGSGSTYYAACINNRFWIGSEIGDCSLIIQRLMDFEKALITKPPQKIIKVFKSKDNRNNLILDDNRRRAIQRIIRIYETNLRSKETVKKNGRYSHRMTNKVFVK